MSDTQHARYVGKDPRYKGETALIRPHVPDFVLAQFDSLEKFGPAESGPMKEIDAQIMRDDPSNFPAIGWHEFAEKDFEVVSR